MSPGFLTDSELGEFLNAPVNSEVLQVGRAACGKVRDMCGPIFPLETVFEVVTVRRGWAPTRYQAVEITSLSGGSLPVDITDFGFKSPSLSSGRVAVTYKAGYEVAPDWAVSAALIIARHLWRTRLGPNRNNPEAQPGVGYLVPNQAEALMADHLLPRGLG